MYDVAIIGAGVTGSAIARELSRYQLNICVIEREEDVCCGTSKANSAIIHAGFDAVPGTLKAKVNVKGNAMMDQIAKELDIPFKRNGSMVVCTKDQDPKGLEVLMERGKANGVPDLQFLDREALIAMEPNLSDDVVCALFAPTGGIVCPFHMTMGYAENACSNGVEFFLNTQVDEIKKAGEFEDYDEYYAEMDAHLAQGLVDVEKAADAFGAAYAEKHCNDKLHYFVGAGNQYGSTYSYAMCYWEEQHWLRTKSIHSAEFFHGMLEVIDKDTPVTVFVGEDSQRRLSERVAAFLPKVCANYTIIDTKDYPIKGISEKYRGSISHLISHAVTQRIDAHIEKINCHPMEIRRYYRQFDY